MSFIPVTLENACFRLLQGRSRYASREGGGRAALGTKAESEAGIQSRVCLFLFRARREASAPCSHPLPTIPVGNDAHGRSLQRGAPTVAAPGDAPWMKTGVL